VKIPPRSLGTDLTERTISAWNTDFLNSPGYAFSHGAEISKWLSHRPKSKTNLIKPVLRQETGWIATATDNFVKDSNFLAIIQPELFKEHLFHNPILDFIFTKERISDLVWLSATRIACFAGDGDAHIFSFSASEHKLQPHAEFKGLHQQRVREMAASPSCDHQVASGGNHIISHLSLWSTIYDKYEFKFKSKYFPDQMSEPG